MKALIYFKFEFCNPTCICVCVLVCIYILTLKVNDETNRLSSTKNCSVLFLSHSIYIKHLFHHADNFPAYPPLNGEKYLILFNNIFIMRDLFCRAICMIDEIF